MSENGNGHVAEKTVKKLTVADILAVKDITTEDVYVHEWNGIVTIQAFTKARQQELRLMATNPKTGQIDSQKLELQLFIHGVIDPKFEPVQATELLQKNAGAIDRVLKRLLDISGMTEDSVREAEKSLQD